MMATLRDLCAAAALLTFGAGLLWWADIATAIERGL